MRALKQMAKVCLRPFYRGLKRPAGPLLRRLRDYLAAPALAHSQQVAAQVQQAMQAMQGMIHESDRMMLALLKSVRLTRPPVAPPAFRAVTLGASRLLAGHPLLTFLYLDPEDVTVTPRAALDDYDRGVSEVLQRFLRPGSFAVEVGAGEGFHTLSLAALVGPAGRVVAVESDPARRALLRENLAAHGLEEVVTLLGGEKDLGAALAEVGARPDLVRLDGPAPASLAEHLEGAAEVKVLFPAPTSAAAEDRVLALCEWLSGVGLRFWLIEEEGVLIPSEAEEIAGGSHRVGSHILAARRID